MRLGNNEFSIIIFVPPLPPSAANISGGALLSASVEFLMFFCFLKFCAVAAYSHERQPDRQVQRMEKFEEKKPSEP